MNYLDKNGLSYFWGKIKSALSHKQDKLTAGANITIENNVISAAGGSTGGTRNIITANVQDSNISVSGSVTLALRKRVQIGTGLTINDDCITIGAGISVVLASANIRFENGGSSQNFNFYLIHRKPDETYTIYGNARRQGVAANTTASASISSQLIEVEEGDTLEIALWKGSSTNTYVVTNVTNLTVEAL